MIICNVRNTCLSFLIRPETDGFHREDVVRVRVRAVESQKTLCVFTRLYNKLLFNNLSHSIFITYIVHSTYLNNIGNNIILLLAIVRTYDFII